MADTTEFWKAFNDRLLFFTRRKAVMASMVEPTWFAQLQAGAKDFRISRIADTNVAVRDVTEDQVAAASTFTTATLAGQDVTRGIFEGTAQTRMLEVFETNVGAALVRDVMRDLSNELALHWDNKLMAHVTGATYGTGTGNGLDLGKLGGTGAANRLGISRSYGGVVGAGTNDSVTATNALVEQIADLCLRMQEYWQDNGLRAEIIGDGAPVRFAMLTLPGVAAAIQRSQAAKANGYRAASDLGATLTTGLALMGGMAAFEGMLHDTAIYSIQPSTDPGALAKPTSADGNWPIYFMPIGGGILSAAMHIWRTDRIAGPLEGGEYVDRWISVARHASELLGQKYLGKATVNAV